MDRQNGGAGPGHRRGRRIWWVLVFVLAVPFESAAQLRVVPRAGVHAPMTDVGRISTGEEVHDVGRREASFAWGAAVELGPPDGTSFRFNGLYGTSGEAPVEGIGCEETTCRARSTLLTVTGTAAFRPLPALALLQPYLIVGGGIKRYGFGLDDGGGVRYVLDEGSRLTGQLGIGVEWTLGIFRGVLEVSDLVGESPVRSRSEAEGGAQHDLFVTLGLALG